MEALTELCDLISQNPNLFSDKLSWLCTRCPSPESLNPSSQSPRINPSHLNALIALARFLSKSKFSDLASPTSTTVRSTLFHFLRAIPSVAFHFSFWPQSSSLQTISLFFSNFLHYISVAADLSPAGFGHELSLFFGTIVLSAARACAAGHEIARVFLAAAANSCPPIGDAEGELVVRCLVEEFVGGDEEGVSSSGSENSRGKEVDDDGSSEISVSSTGNGGRSGSGSNGGFGVVEVEGVEGLEKMEIGFRLVRRVLDRVGGVRVELMERFHGVAVKQLKSLPGFLKVV